MTSLETSAATIDWTSIPEDSGNPLWRVDRGLYAYLDPKSLEILYIGKVDGTTIRQRWVRSGKSGFWDDLEKERGIHRHVVMAGKVALDRGRLSRELLADIESLLICRLQPWGNIQSRRQRIARPGLLVKCVGEWPLKRASFYDF